MSLPRSVRFWWVTGSKPADAQRTLQTMGLAFRTVLKDGTPFPHSTLVRSGAHGTTTDPSTGLTVQDKFGNHWTLSFKDDRMFREGTHRRCHGYTSDPNSFKLRKADCRGETKDSVRKRNGQEYWPAEAKLEDGGEHTMEELHKFPE